MKIKLLAWQQSVLFAFGFFLAVSTMAASLQLVTTIDTSVGPPVSGGGDSMNPIISPDGRYVLFASTADNLALTSSNTPFAVQGSPKINVFLRDRTNATTALVSVNLAGTGGGNGDSIPIEISTNGQYALFESAASNLVPGDTNNANDVFVRDLVNGTNILVSINTNGGCANGVSGESAMTPDGRFVVFASTASNLVPNDTNGIRDIFVRDLLNGTTVRASSDTLAAMVPAPSGYTGGTFSSDSPEITPDGHYAAFITTFTNTSGNPNISGVFVSDLVAGTTTLVNSNLFVTNSVGTIVGYNLSGNLAISTNGQFVAFESATNTSGGNGIIQRYNLQTGFTDTVCTNASSSPISISIAIENSPFYRDLDMTPDGRFIVFVVSTNSNSYIFLWDGQTGTTTLVSCDTNNAMPANSICDWPAIDSSGCYVAFLSSAATLTTNVVTGDFHLYLRDLQAGTTILLDADTNGVGFPKDLLNPVRLTPDGRYAAFDCTEEMPATNIYAQAYEVGDRSLVPSDNNHAYDVFLRDLTTNTIELISVCQPSLPSQTPAGSSTAAIFSVDTAGRYIAFASAADSLVPNFTNKYRAVFMHDLLGGTNCLVSVDMNGLANATGMSSDPSISGDGRYVVFTSDATNLVAGDTNIEQNVFLRDLQAGTTTLVSVNTLGTGPGNGDSYSPVISANGRCVLFLSTANNLAVNSPSSTETITPYLRDLHAGRTFALPAYDDVSSDSTLPSLASMTPDGHFVAYLSWPGLCVGDVWDTPGWMNSLTNVYTSNPSIASLAISPDGNRIAYSVSYVGGGNGFYVADRRANSSWEIGPPLYGLHTGLQFSGDARFLAYSTNAQFTGIANVCLYDFVTKTNFLVSQSNPTGIPNGPSDSPAISSDGRFVAYRSYVTNITFGVTNSVPNVFLYDQQTGSNTLLSANASGTTGNNHSFAPQFSWDGRTVVFQTWASDLIPQDFNQANDLVAVKIATSNPVQVFTGQMVFVPSTLQSPTLTWPAMLGTNYQVQFKNNLTDSTWLPLNGNTWVDGTQGYATDLAPNAGQRFYRVVTF
ncbi:MAG: hypothetical protein WAO21_12730 [Verrucomicrobiia bacterium]